jgi:hypothetical protein
MEIRRLESWMIVVERSELEVDRQLQEAELVLNYILQIGAYKENRHRSKKY